MCNCSIKHNFRYQSEHSWNVFYNKLYEFNVPDLQPNENPHLFSVEAKKHVYSQLRNTMQVYARTSSFPLENSWPVI